MGIWEDRRQFEMNQDQLVEILSMLADSGFLGFENLYGAGGKAEVNGSAALPSIEGGVQIICRVELDLVGYRNESAQRRKGEQSAELRTLAKQLLSFCGPMGEAGVGAGSLEGGFAKIAAGTLAPEALNIVLHRKPEPGMQADGTGYRK